MSLKLVLIVEDERDLVKTLEYNLQREGFQTRSAFTGVDALRLAVEDPIPDLMILDLMLPDISGLELCRELRRTQTTRNMPIIILTARGEEIDRVVGFELGADDYVVKPFSVREFMLRVKAILRRGRSADEATARKKAENEKHVFGCLKVDVVAHRLWVDGQELRLTALEFILLNTLLTRKGWVQTREVLLSDVWGANADMSTRTVSI